MRRETLRVTWKIIRRKGHGRTPKSYCNYIVENENHKHRLKTIDGTKLFEILDNTVIFKKSGTTNEVFIDGVYDKNDQLLYVTNFRKDSIEFFRAENTVGEYKRTCPLCEKEIYYKYRNNRNRAKRKKAPCRSCSTTIKNKKRVTNLNKNRIL